MWFDSLIGFFSPKAEFHRVQFRIAQKRAFDGASKGRRTAGWRATGTSVNSENASQIDTLRNRSRDLVRNNPYANRAISLVSTNTVGRGIMLNLKNPTVAREEKQKALWRKWAGTTDCDFDGCMNFNAMQALIMRSVAESGEIIIRRRRVRRSDGSIGIKLQLLESDHLVSDIIIQTFGNNKVIQGVEVDSSGTPVAYHLYKNHPGNIGIDNFDTLTSLEAVRVPAEDIIHVFKKERPGQLRGVPWLSSVIIRLRELDEFEDAMIVRQKIAACFSAFVHDMDAPDTVGNNPKGEFDIEKLEPGIIEFLPPGKDIKFATPPLPQGEAYKFFITSFLHSIAAGVGISYESLTGDLSEVNFSSARMGWLEMSRNIDCWRFNMLIPQCNEHVFEWFNEAITFLGEDTTETVGTWTPPKREMIDPTKEVPAKIRAIRAGIETLSDAIRENGKEPEDHFEELAKDNEILDKLKLIVDTDPRNVTAAGMFQVEESEGESADTTKDT